VTGPQDWTPPSVRLLLVRRIALGGVAVPVVIAGFLLALLISDAKAGVIVAAILLVVAVAAEFFLRRRVQAWGYAERADDLLVRRGVLIKRLSVVPYGRMQYVDVTAGPLERSFGLATVRMHTAAAASDARIPGLSAGEAARLRDRLAALGEARAAGL
jgi:membrane protein YdbS with pleckstrin-like domain